MLGDVVPALNKAREQGKTRFIGFTAIGETAALHPLIASGAFDTAQVPFNALNPSAGEAIPAAYPAQDYGRILDLAAQHGVGTIGIRVLAGGALSGRKERSPLGDATVEPIGSGATYAADVARARRLEPMVREGHAGEPDRDGDALCDRERKALHHRDRPRQYRRAGSRDRGDREGAVVGGGARAAEEAAGWVSRRGALKS